jgi:lantibiotic modifying enzyme
MAWQPLLEGADRDRAEESVQAILDDLPGAEWDIEEGPSLAGGIAGWAVLHAYLALAGRGADHAAIAVEQLRHATAAVASRPTVASLYSGLSGVGWALAHLQDRLPGLDGDEDLAAIDEVLLSHVEQSPWRDDYDLINGLVGFGVYALERWPRPAARACLERVVDHLTETAERRDDGVTWWTNPAWLPPETQQEFPRGYYNLGLAHGVPGVIALLGQACAAGVASRARPLLDGAVCWLLAQQQPGGFPHWVAPDAPAPPGRLAWCYGDAGVAAALLVAARSAGEPAWEREAVGLARRAADRPADRARVVDTGLCHGAAGLGHLFNRLFQATGDTLLGTAARFWFRRALEMRQPGRGLAGFAASRGARPDEQQWVADPGLLTGATGIALALLAATTPVEPAWDRMLMVAVPPA